MWFVFFRNGNGATAGSGNHFGILVSDGTERVEAEQQQQQQRGNERPGVMTEITDGGAGGGSGDGGRPDG